MAAPRRLETPNTLSSSSMESFLRDFSVTRCLLTPPYQRSPCWKKHQNCGLIASIMLNHPIPGFLLYKLHADNPDDAESYAAGYRYEMVDGQNRMRALRAFYDSTHLISSTGKPEIVTWNDACFKDLSDDHKEWFTHFNVSVTIIHASMTLAERKYLFTCHQDGTRISRAEYTMNSSHPVCTFVARTRLKEPLREHLCGTMKAFNSQQNHLVADCISLWFNRDADADDDDEPYACLERDSKMLEKILNCHQTAAVGSNYDFSYLTAADDRTLLALFETLLAVMRPLIGTCSGQSMFHKYHIATLFRMIACCGTDPAKLTLDILRFWNKTTRSLVSGKSHTVAESCEIRQELEDVLVDLLANPAKAAPQIVLVPRRTTVPAATKTRIWTLFFGMAEKRGACQCCGTELEKNERGKWEAAHIVPVRAGGTNDLENLVPTCVGCNRGCGAMNLLEWCRTVYPDAPCLSRSLSSSAAASAAVAGAGIVE